MNNIKFQRPIGAKADVEELLYISALHQSSIDLRQDASIVADDIRNYLISRHGIDVSNDIVKNIILDGFRRKGRMDLLELVTLLFIPQLCKVKQIQQDPQRSLLLSDESHEELSDYKFDDIKSLDLSLSCPKFLDFVLKMILHDTTGDEEPKELTPTLICEIFRKYGEALSPGNENDNFLITEMLRVANQGLKNKDVHRYDPVLLDTETFLQLLTHDLQCYDNNEAQLSTNFSDVFGTGCQRFGPYMLERNDIEFVEDPSQDTEGKRSKNEKNPNHQEEQNEPQIFRRIKTAKGIDYIAGTYSCKYHISMLWVVFLFGFSGFILPLSSRVQELIIRKCPEFETLQSWNGNRAAFLCKIEGSMIQWIVIFLFAMFFGFLWISLESAIGHSLEFKNVWGHFLITIFNLSIFIVIPFIQPFNPSTPWLFYTQLIAYSFGTVLMCKRFVRDAQSIYPRLLAYMVPTGLVHESHSKRAALRKIKNMQEHAIYVISSLEEDSVIKAYYGKALSNFSKLEDVTETCGGLSWTATHYRNLNLFSHEGLWVSARFIASNVGQMILSSIILVFGVTLFIYVAKSWIPPEELEMTVVNNLNIFLTAVADQGIVQNAVNNIIRRTFNYVLQFLVTLDDAGILQFDCLALGSYLMKKCTGEMDDDSTIFACNLFMIQHEKLCEALEPIYRPANVLTQTTEAIANQDEIFNSTTLRIPLVNYVSRAVSDNIAHQANKLYPRSRYMVTIPTAIASVIAVLVSVSLAAILIPSLVSVTLKLRSGIIPTLKSKSFSSIQYEVNNVTKLTGGLFWSNLVSSLVIGGTFGILSFLSLWQVSVHLVQQLLALLIGVYIIVLTRFLLSRWFRVSTFKGFYRIKPFSANIYALINECLNMGLTITMALSRALTLFLLSEFYVGRMDTSFVAEGVGDFGWVSLEPYHRWFLASILSVEAHRHPYIETLGVMYLMKLKHREMFNNHVGIKWRTILVTALMPWLDRYRVVYEQEEGNVNEEEKAKEEN